MQSAFEGLLGDVSNSEGTSSTGQDRMGKYKKYLPRDSFGRGAALSSHTHGEAD